MKTYSNPTKDGKKFLSENDALTYEKLQSFLNKEIFYIYSSFNDEENFTIKSGIVIKIRLIYNFIVLLKFKNNNRIYHFSLNDIFFSENDALVAQNMLIEEKLKCLENIKNTQIKELNNIENLIKIYKNKNLKK